MSNLIGIMNSAINDTSLDSQAKAEGSLDLGREERSGPFFFILMSHFSHIIESKRSVKFHLSAG